MTTLAKRLEGLNELSLIKTVKCKTTWADREGASNLLYEMTVHLNCQTYT